MARSGRISQFQWFAANLQGSDNDRSQLLWRIVLTLWGVLVFITIVMGVVSVLGLVASIITWSWVLTLLLFSIMALVIRQLIKRNNYRMGITILLYSTLALLFLNMVLFGGTTGPIVMAFAFPLIAAGMFGRGQDVIWLTIVAVIGYLLLSIGESSRLITPPVPITGGIYALVYILIFVCTMFCLAYVALIWASSTHAFVSQRDAQAEELYQTNQRLIEKNIQQVELGSDLSMSASELLTASHEQASGATQQASAVSEVSTTIEELGSTARQIAVAAEQVADASQRTLENLSSGQDAVDRSIQAMDRIRGRMQDVSSRVLNLGERSQQIGEIIDLINDLSDETHLLALNAAIEAAGAGEHGRRFAVVAAEVKSLANRALAAAKEVKGVIAEIQQATNSAVLAAEEGGKEVERGVELAHSAGDVMNEIVMAAERTAQSSSEISLATSQQQSASEQVVETMREIADVARRTATGARQVQDAAQRLTAIANRLHGLSASERE